MDAPGRHRSAATPLSRICAALGIALIVVNGVRIRQGIDRAWTDLTFAVVGVIGGVIGVSIGVGIAVGSAPR